MREELAQAAKSLGITMNDAVGMAIAKIAGMQHDAPASAEWRQATIERLTKKSKIDAVEMLGWNL
jgi:antitoxin component of RelBE/YafQ-DinJ toxin-antitoxin module